MYFNDASRKDMLNRKSKLEKNEIVSELSQWLKSKEGKKAIKKALEEARIRSEKFRED